MRSVMITDLILILWKGLRISAGEDFSEGGPGKIREGFAVVELAAGRVIRAGRPGWGGQGGMGSRDRGGREEAGSALISSLPHRPQSIFPNTSALVSALVSGFKEAGIPGLFLNLNFSLFFQNP
jgi:hypothetical protein